MVAGLLQSIFEKALLDTGMFLSSLEYHQGEP
jgi:hypothetical protein